MSHRWSRICLVLTILVPSMVFSQVIIRERVELKRQISPPRLLSASGDSTFLVRAEWDINYDDPNYVQFLVTTECGIDAPIIEQGQRYRVREVPYVPRGVYSVGFWHFGWPDTLHVIVRVFKANEPERTCFLTIGPYGGWGTPPGGGFELGDFWGTPFTTPFFRSFTMRIWKEEIFPSDENFFEVAGKPDTCTNIQWYPSADSVTLTITAATSAGMVTVEARSKGIVEAKTFRVLPFLGKTLKLEAGPPIIAFGENGGFGVEVLDASGEPVPIPQGITFKYEILEGAQWGVLFDYETGQTRTVVEGAPSVIDFFTADTAQYEDKRVVVRVSSSDAGLTPDTAEVFILPGLLKVTVTPTMLQYGQSAEIVAEGVYQDGELEPLDPSVLYSYEIVQATDAGYLVVGTDTTRRDIIPDVGPTATFTAEEETPQPDSVQVIIKVTAREEVILGKKGSVGVTPALPPGLQLSVRGGKARTQEYIEHVGVARVVVKKCKEPIVQCSSDDAVPQSFNRSSIEAYQQGQLFTWTDASGQTQSVVVDACDYIPPGATADLQNRLGLTLVMPAVNPNRQGRTYVPLSDVRTTVCLDVSDASNSKWTYQFDNIRVPVFTSACARPSYHEMGGDESEWTQTVTNPDVYEKALPAMKWWVSGNYVQGGFPPNMFTFNSMIKAHENVHFEDRSQKIEEAFNEAFREIFRNRFSQKDHPCPEDVLAFGIVTPVKDKLADALISAAKAEVRSEERTDYAARNEREKILRRFEVWAKTQTWFPK